MPSSFALGDHFENFIQAMVASGRYDDASHVVRDGLRLLESTEREQAEDQAELDAFLAESFADIDAGRVYSMEEVLDHLETRRAARAKTSAAG